MTSVIKLIIFIVVILTTSCFMQKSGDQKVNQGIRGTVKWLEGNLMPSPGQPQHGNGKPIKRRLLIYEAVNFNQVEGPAPLFKKINATLVKELESNTDGIFACQLPVGVYSIFTVEPTGVFFANSFDGNGLINTVKVEYGKVSEINIDVNYRAAY